jgi:hypothetical protein
VHKKEPDSRSLGIGQNDRTNGTDLAVRIAIDVIELALAIFAGK